MQRIGVTQEKIVFSTLLAKNISIAEELATTDEWSILFARNTVIANDNVDNNDEESKPAWISSTQTWLAIKRWWQSCANNFYFLFEMTRQHFIKSKLFLLAECWKYTWTHVHSFAGSQLHTYDFNFIKCMEGTTYSMKFHWTAFVIHMEFHKLFLKSNSSFDWNASMYVMENYY